MRLGRFLALLDFENDKVYGIKRKKWDNETLITIRVDNVTGQYLTKLWIGNIPCEYIFTSDDLGADDWYRLYG